MRLFRELRSHIQYKIIVPFLLLTLIVALIGAGAAFLFITNTAQERLNNQLAQAARSAADSVVARESGNLEFLREASFAQANLAVQAPAVPDAVAARDTAALERALEPYFQVGAQRQGVRLDRLIAFDAAGRSLLDWERTGNRDGTLTVVRHLARDLGALWFVPRVLAGQRDVQGDKFAGLLDLGEDNRRYLFSVTPVFQDDRIVGGLIVAMRVDSLLEMLHDDSLAAIVTLYSAQDGAAFASTQQPSDGLATLDVRRDLVPRIRDVERAREQALIDTVRVNGRDYQFAYAPLQIRGNVVGLISVALASDYVVLSWSDARLPLMILTMLLMLAIVGLGIFVARQITRPLESLVATAQAVTRGDLERRSQVRVDDEIGLLSQSINEMTAHLLDLYRAVRAESGQRAAIVNSIADGVIVCDPGGEVLVINRMTRRLLNLADDTPGPRRFEEIPLIPLTEVALTFGALRSHDLYTLRAHVVRVVSAPVVDEDGTRLGKVYVLQDLTSEVAIDRAKTNFIGTISHELRTPLTVLNGSSELMLRELVGPLTDEQRTLVDSMRRHTMTMTTLLNNVITIANLESGTLAFEIGPVHLAEILDDLLWSLRPAIMSKGLDLQVSLADNLPPLLADSQQLRNVLYQLLDNARRYTDVGSITIHAVHAGDQVRVDICDTGPGIGPELAEYLFTRFTRGSEGINSSERGIGLGLAIAKLLIERQEGTIWLDSTSSHGSTFSLMVPCVRAESHYNINVLATAA